jgi:hypothetical protein
MDELREIVSPNTLFYQCYLTDTINDEELIINEGLIYDSSMIYIAINDDIVEFFEMLVLHNVKLYNNRYIFAAITLNRFKILQLLIRLGLNPNAPDEKDSYPIEYALVAGHKEIVSYLYDGIELSNRLLLLSIQIDNHDIFDIIINRVKYIDDIGLYMMYELLMINNNLRLLNVVKANRPDLFERIKNMIDQYD